MDIDFAKLSPSMSQARLVDNMSAKLINLAKKQMDMQSSMLSEIMDSTAVSVPASDSIIDVKI